MDGNVEVVVPVADAPAALTVEVAVGEEEECVKERLPRPLRNGVEVEAGEEEPRTSEAEVWGSGGVSLIAMRWSTASKREPTWK